MGMSCIISKVSSKRCIAEGLYDALDYEGKIYNITAEVTSGLHFTPESEFVFGINKEQSVSCTKTDRHTKQEFLRKALNGDNFYTTGIIASVDKADKRRVSIITVLPSLKERMIKEMNDPELKGMILMVNTPGFEPTEEEAEEIDRFTTYIHDKICDAYERRL